MNFSTTTQAWNHSNRSVGVPTASELSQRICENLKSLRS